MTEEQKSALPPTFRAGEIEPDARWPVSYAIMFMAALSIALWSLIIAAASWAFH